MVVLHDWQNEACGITARGGLEALASFHHAPAVVLTASAPGGLKINLLNRVLPDIPNEEISGKTIEGKPPGVTEAVGPDFLASFGVTGERIAVRNSKRFAAVDVDSKDFAQ